MLSESAKQKARNISYALIRVSFYVKRQELSVKIEGLAFELLENVSRLTAGDDRENINKSLETISALDGLIRLGHSIYEIEPVNATALVRELDNLNSAIRSPFGGSPEGGQSELPKGNNAAIRQLPNLDELLSSHDKQKEAPMPAKSEDRKEDGEKVNVMAFSGASNSGGNGNSAINAAIRQSAIISKIRSGNGNGFRMREIVAEFPGVSERTLRYDLQRLCGQGTIERVGNGGPASYYRSV